MRPRITPRAGDPRRRGAAAERRCRRGCRSSPGRWKSEPPVATSPWRRASAAYASRRSGVWSGRWTSIPRSPAPARRPHEGREGRAVHAQRGGVGEGRPPLRRRSTSRSASSGAMAAVGDGGRAAVAEEAVEGVLAVAGVARGDDARRPGGDGRWAPRRGARRRRSSPARRRSARRATMRRARASRAARSSASRAGERPPGPARGGSPAGASSPRAARTDSSTPGTTRTPSAAPAAMRRGHARPAVSWSVTARTATPAAAASSTSASGGSEPSEASGVEVEVGPAGGYAVTARPTRPRGLELGEDARRALGGRLLLGADVHVGARRRLVGVADAGELLDLAGEGLRVEALHVAAGALLDRGVDEHLDEGAELLDQAARRGARLDVGRDRRDQRHDAGAGEAAGDPADALDVRVAVLLREPEALGEVGAHDVAVEVLGERTRAARARGRRSRRSSSCRSPRAR